MTAKGIAGAFWGLGGVCLLLGSALWRLTPLALEIFKMQLSLLHVAATIVCVLFMAFAEGYRGFQQNFSPRVAARARHLAHHPRLLHLLLAPLFCMGFFHATRRRKIVAWSLTSGIILLILLVRLLPQPWRGIVDLGVVVGLSWGLLALLFFGFQAFFTCGFHRDPEVPST